MAQVERRGNGRLQLLYAEWPTQEALHSSNRSIRQLDVPHTSCPLSHPPAAAEQLGITPSNPITQQTPPRLHAWNPTTLPRGHASFYYSHLKDLLADQKRCESLIKEDLGLYVDFSRQRMTQETIKVRHACDLRPACLI